MCFYPLKYVGPFFKAQFKQLGIEWIENKTFLIHVKKKPLLWIFLFVYSCKCVYTNETLFHCGCFCFHSVLISKVTWFGGLFQYSSVLLWPSPWQ